MKINNLIFAVIVFLAAAAISSCQSQTTDN